MTPEISSEIFTKLNTFTFNILQKSFKSSFFTAKSVRSMPNVMNWKLETTEFSEPEERGVNLWRGASEMFASREKGEQLYPIFKL